jgi:hypothetical protein
LSGTCAPSIVFLPDPARPDPYARKANEMNDSNKSDYSGSDRDEQSTFSSVASDIKDAASQKLDEAMTDVRSRADSAKSGVADEVQGVANALRRASEELRNGSAQERTLGTIASTLADASDQIRDKDLGQIVQMVSKVARDNPVLFLGGAALLGFAASRYAKASGVSSGTASARADTRSRVDVFVDEGNPNTQALYLAS